MIFYCLEVTQNFSDECGPVAAPSPSAAAEIFATRLFDERRIDVVEIFVASSRDAKTAQRFEVKRTVTVTDNAFTGGMVDLPAAWRDEDD